MVLLEIALNIDWLTSDLIFISLDVIVSTICFPQGNCAIISTVDSPFSKFNFVSPMENLSGHADI